MLVRAALLGSDNLAFVYSDSVVAGLTWLLGLAVVAGARDGSLPDGRVSAGEAPDARRRVTVYSGSVWGLVWWPSCCTT